MKIGKWEVDGDLVDGGRIGLLRYEGIDLLTTRPKEFRAPQKNYGQYELRPVYGYDDCFPTVQICGDWPDHGELLWLPWEGTLTDCSVRSERWPLTFRRRLKFQDTQMTWKFSVINHGNETLEFQHVMHPLLPLDQVTKIELPVAGVAEKLMKVARGQKEMLYVPVPEGWSAVTLRGGVRVLMTFPVKMFPTLSIWWNNGAYPDEDGLRRIECAFEPTPGPDSKLTNGTVQKVGPKQTLEWEVMWDVTK